MTDGTTNRRAATRWGRLRDRLAQLIFREPDLDALARGWEVHRPTPLRRVYRDPRWHSIVACADCQGTGLDGAHECPVCDGRGTLRLAVADTATDPAADPAAVR